MQTQADTAEQAPAYEDLLEFFKAMLDPVRLRIAGRLAAGPCSISVLAQDLGEPAAGLARHLAVLVAAGVALDRGSGTYDLDHEGLRAATPHRAPLRALAGARRRDRRAQPRACFVHTRRPHRLLAGRRAAEAGACLPRSHPALTRERTYNEREVNAIITRMYDDYTTVRRALVDYHFMNRDHGVYWLGSARLEPAAGSGPGRQYDHQPVVGHRWRSGAHQSRIR